MVHFLLQATQTSDPIIKGFDGSVFHFNEVRSGSVLYLLVLSCTPALVTVCGAFLNPRPLLQGLVKDAEHLFLC